MLCFSSSRWPLVVSRAILGSLPGPLWLLLSSGTGWMVLVMRGLLLLGGITRAAARALRLARRRSSTLNFCVPYPRLQNPAYPARVLSNEGRFMRRSEVGQSESWPEGQPEGRCGAWGCARKHGPGRPWVSVRPLKEGLPL